MNRITSVCILAGVVGAFVSVYGAGLDAILTYGGSYEVHINNKPWFRSAEPFLVVNGRRYGNNVTSIFRGQVPDMDAELILKDAEKAEGADAVGNFRSMQYTYFAGDTRMDLEIRVYDSVVVFSQSYPDGISRLSPPDNRTVVSGFPAFQWDIVFQSLFADAALTFMAPLEGENSVFLDRWRLANLSMVPSGNGTSGPLCLFNTSSNDAVVLSPLTQVMHVSPWQRIWPGSPPIIEGQTYWGLDRDLESLPSGFKAEVVLVYSAEGVGKAMEKWGKIFHNYNNPTSTSSPKPAPASLSSLGYWTGQGSYYRDNTTSNTTYESILMAVKNASVQNRVPLGFMELDSWWYQSEDGQSEAVVTWDVNNQSLPSGLRALHKGLGLPFTAVCGWWSSNTSYASQNNGPYLFHIEGDLSLPLQQEFWDDLFTNASENGIQHVIMDKMATQYFSISLLQSEAGLASDWLRNMSVAANQAGIALTLSDASPRIVLEASQYPAVVQVRVSEPYMESSTQNQWKIGVASLLPRALGLAAFKGAFWSHAQEAGNPYGNAGKEENPALQALVASLSMGSVVLGDRQDLLSSFIVDRCCRSDGVILKPSQPITAMDSQLIETAVNDTGVHIGETWSTTSSLDVIQYNNVTSHYVQGVILAADMPSNAFRILPSAAFPGVYKDSSDLRVWSWIAGQDMFWSKFSQNKPLVFQPAQCAMDNSSALPCVFYVSPPLVIHEGHTIVHLGGENKFVPLSPQRIKGINTTIDVTLTLQGQPGEHVTMFYYVNDERRSFDVTIDSDGVSDVILNTVNPTTHAPNTTSHPTGKGVRLVAVNVVDLMLLIWICFAVKCLN